MDFSQSVQLGASYNSYCVSSCSSAKESKCSPAVQIDFVVSNLGGLPHVERMSSRLADRSSLGKDQKLFEPQQNHPTSTSTTGGSWKKNAGATINSSTA